MNIKDQVCTLDQAKRLKELGAKQEGAVFYYDEENDLQYNGSDYDFDSPDYSWSAFTVAELGVMIAGKEHHMPYFTGTIWQRMTKKKVYTSIVITGKSEASARAAMLIHLIENNFVTVDEINSRI